jgi:serine/threonine-protein kinase
MATVWRAWDLRLERAVAVKMLDGAGLDDPSMAQRFDREARTVACLAHPNIVAVYDFGTQDGVAYLVMELIDGVSVATLLASGPLPVGQAVAIAGQTCDALDAAHAAGVIHRDIKPANIMVTPSGRVKVCDFGIARQMHAAGQTLTAPATAIGTSDYMAPEQAIGDPVDARTDLYALGCVLYAMLAGGPPFAGDGPLGVLYQHLHEAPAPLRSRRGEVPAELDDLVGHLLAKNPADRPTGAPQVQAELAHLADQPTRTLPPLPVTAPPQARATAVVLTPTRTLPAQRQAEDPAGGPAEGRGRPAPGTVALAAATVIALVIAGVLAVALLARSGARPQASPQPTTAAPTASAASPTPTATLAPTTPPAPADQLAALQATLQQQAQGGQLDAHAADEFGHQLDDLTKTLADGHTHEITDKIRALRDKLVQLRKEGKITTTGYNTLTAGLGQLAASLPAGTANDH